MSINPDINPDEETWTRVGSYPDATTAHEYALVILAMGLPCWIESQAGSSTHDLLVSPKYVELASRELDEYAHELKHASPADAIQPSPFAYSAGWSQYLLWVLILLIVHRLQPQYPQLIELGASSSTGLVDDHQWWRPFTALFLHADIDHLTGNLLSGLFFATLVSSSIGPWRGWLLILASGTLGNLVTSLLIWPEPYRAIGASTAVFAALGILSGLGLAWMLRFRSQVPWVRILAPLIGGIVVLGMTGSGLPESNTDVMGHVFGFVAGVIAGTLWGSFTETIRLNYKESSETSTVESDART